MAGSAFFYARGDVLFKQASIVANISRLPDAFRFAGSEVFIRRDEDTGDVILSVKPAS